MKSLQIFFFLCLLIRLQVFSVVFTFVGTFWDASWLVIVSSFWKLMFVLVYFSDALSIRCGLKSQPWLSSHLKLSPNWFHPVSLVWPHAEETEFGETCEYACNHPVCNLLKKQKNKKKLSESVFPSSFRYEVFLKHYSNVSISVSV